MRIKKLVPVLIAVMVVSLAGGSLFAGAGCSKSKAEGSAVVAAKPCCEGCPTAQATEAMVAMQKAAADSGCAKTQALANEAVVAVNNANAHEGCEKSKAVKSDAAVVALQKTAESTSDAKTREAAEAALVAYKKVHGENDSDATR